MSLATRSLSQPELNRYTCVSQDITVDPKTRSRGSWAASEMEAVIEYGTVGSRYLLEQAACPCCRQCIDDKQLTLKSPERVMARSQSLFSREGDTKEADDSCEYDYDDDEDKSLRLPGVVEEGVAYNPKRVLVEGWLHKKGTGNDWLGSRSWKPRWARLVMARVDGYSVDLPLLMIYWYDSTPTPSTVISLESTVVLPVDKKGKNSWDSFRFEIKTARKAAQGKSNPITRTFTAPQKARDTWVYVISQALLQYEKENAKARKAATNAAKESNRVKNPSRADRFLTCPMPPPLEVSKFANPPSPPEMRRAISSPPTSPPGSPRSRNFPRPQNKRPSPRRLSLEVTTDSLA